MLNKLLTSEVVAVSRLLLVMVCCGVVIGLGSCRKPAVEEGAGGDAAASQASEASAGKADVEDTAGSAVAGQSGAAGPWRALFNGRDLDGWKVSAFGTQSEVAVEAGELVLPLSDGCTGVTATEPFPKMNYEVSVRTKRVLGNDFFCGMTFPVGDKYCSLICGGWGGSVVGISSIDFFDAANNETTRVMSFENDRWYNIKVRVTPGKIEAWIDSRKVVDLELEGRELSTRPEVEASKPFGIATWCTSSAIKHVRVRLIQGAK